MINQGRAAAVGETRSVMKSRAEILYRLGGLQRLSRDTKAAMPLFAQSTALFGALLESDSADDENETVELRSSLASSLSSEAAMHRLQRELDLSREKYNRALALRAENLAARPEDPRLQRHFARTSGDLANLVQTSGESAEALQLFEQVSRQYDKLIQRDPNSLPDLIGLARTYGNRAVVLDSLQRVPEARDALQQSIELFQRAVELDPTYVEYRENLARAWRLQAEFAAVLGDDEQAEANLVRTRELLEQIVLMVEDSFRFRRDLAKADFELGKFFAARQHWAEAADAYGKADPSYQQVIAEKPDDVFAQLYAATDARVGARGAGTNGSSGPTAATS